MQNLNPEFMLALDFIEAHHNRTDLTINMHPSVFVAEFGVAQVGAQQNNNNSNNKHSNRQTKKAFTEESSGCR